MRFLRSTLGYMIAGMIVMSVWGWLAGSYGMLGGFVGAILIIGPMWYMNHYVGLIQNDDDAAFVDMALGIAVTGVMRDVFSAGSNAGAVFVDTLPTLGLVVLGGIIGGVVAALIEKDMAKKAAEDSIEKRAA